MLMELLLPALRTA